MPQLQGRTRSTPPAATPEQLQQEPEPSPQGQPTVQRQLDRSGDGVRALVEAEPPTQAEHLP